jgi:hypothetical protein
MIVSNCVTYWWLYGELLLTVTWGRWCTGYGTEMYGGLVATGLAGRAGVRAYSCNIIIVIKDISYRCRYTWYMQVKRIKNKISSSDRREETGSDDRDRENDCQ